MAYYCRTHAMDQAMLLRTPENSKELMPFLVALMDRLEEDKKSLPAQSPAEAKGVVEAFADRVLQKADEVRARARAGRLGVSPVASS